MRFDFFVTIFPRKICEILSKPQLTLLAWEFTTKITYQLPQSIKKSASKDYINILSKLCYLKSHALAVILIRLHYLWVSFLWFIYIIFMSVTDILSSVIVVGHEHGKIHFSHVTLLSKLYIKICIYLMRFYSVCVRY